MFTLADLWWSHIVVYAAELNLFWGKKLLWCWRNEKLMWLLLPWSVTAITSDLSSLISVTFNRVVGLRQGLGLQVCVYVCVQLDPNWSHLHKRHRLPRNTMRGKHFIFILLCQRKECSQTQIVCTVFVLTRESSHLVKSKGVLWEGVFLSHTGAYSEFKRQLN